MPLFNCVHLLFMVVLITQDNWVPAACYWWLQYKCQKKKHQKQIYTTQHIIQDNWVPAVCYWWLQYKCQEQKHPNKYIQHNILYKITECQQHATDDCSISARSKHTQTYIHNTTYYRVFLNIFYIIIHNEAYYNTTLTTMQHKKFHVFLSTNKK